MIKYYRSDEDKEIEVKKINNINGKICVIYEYTKLKETEIEEDIKSKFEILEDQLEELKIREIKIRNKWKMIKNNIEEQVQIKVNEIINLNKNKKDKQIDVSQVDQLITSLRTTIYNTPREIIKEIEVGIEMDNMYDIKEEIIKKSEINKEKIKRPVGKTKKIQ